MIRIPVSGIVLSGDIMEVLGEIEDESFHMAVTSPPYYKLRRYGGCGEIGWEETPQKYVETLVKVFREVRRVLRRDGTFWLNVGDCFSSGVGSNLKNCLRLIIKESVLFLSGRLTLTVTSKSQDVLAHNKSFPDGKFSTFFGMKRVFLKQGNDNLCQLFDSFESENGYRIVDAVGSVEVTGTDAKICVNESDDIRIVISQSDLDCDSSFEIPVTAGPAKNNKTSFPIKEPAEPKSEFVGDVQSAGDSLSVDSVSERLLKVDTVNESVSFRNAFGFCSECFGDFRVTKASKEHLSFSLMDGAIEIAVGCVGHLYLQNKFGSLIRYAESYEQAERKSNALGPKQLLGIPAMLRQALVEDGWICRSELIWEKPNVRPDSCRDRCAVSHEQVFLLSRSPKYYYDLDAVREPYTKPMNRWGGNELKADGVSEWDKGTGHGTYRDRDMRPNKAGRTKRTVWKIPTKPSAWEFCWNCRTLFEGEDKKKISKKDEKMWCPVCESSEHWVGHFAAFPDDLVEPCVKAGSGEMGCCPECRTPLRRILKKTKKKGQAKDSGMRKELHGPTYSRHRSSIPGGQSLVGYDYETKGWEPGCQCEFEKAVPCTVFDPFVGSGTSGIVTRRLGRNFFGVDLNEQYVAVANARISRSGRR